MIKLRKKALSKFKKIKTDAAWQEYKDLRNYITMAVRNEKKAYLQHKFRVDPKSFWQTLKSLNISSSPKSQPLSIGTPSDFNAHFLNSIPTMDLTANNTFLESYRNAHFADSDFVFSEVDEHCVNDIISKIKTNASGADDIDRRMISLITPYLTPYLTFLINKCLISSYFPLVWKCANVLPVPKVSNPSGISDFRAISILPILSKVLEKVMYNQLNSFATSKNILPSTQSGFRSLHSTTTALLHVSDEILRACDKGMTTSLVLLDFSRAFDTLDHAMLLAKLKYFGLSERAVKLFSSYLDNRKQRVCIDKNRSDFLSLGRGVPQGSILGPLLFSLYTSDFCKFLKSCQSHQYADDMQIYYSFNSNNIAEAARKINDDLQVVLEVSTCHGLHLNGSKSKILLFGPHKDKVKENANFRIEIGGSLLTPSETTKNLGVMFDTNFRYESHVSGLMQKCYSKLKILYIHKDILSTDIKLRLCDSLILSVVSYCDVVYWPALTIREKTSLQKLQNSCLKFCYSARKFDHVTPLLQASQWLTLDERFRVHLATLVHRVVLNNSPSYLFEKLVRGSDVHERSTRHRFRFNVPKHRTAMFQRSFSYNAIKIYNTLSKEVVSRTSMTTFRRAVRSFIVGERG